MKPLKNLLLFALILTESWTASSQITGISRDQKIEIVSTLETYPIVLKELDLHYEMLQRCEEIQDLYFEQVQKCDDQILKLEAINSNNNEQIDLLREQLKKKKGGGWLVPVLVGVV